MFRSILIGHFLIGTYPRSRGESLQFLHHACAMSGSSPLTLGKLEGVHADLPDVSLIPAHAGKTSADPRGAASSPAHPRSRGENSRRTVRPASGPGSSPLMRGKRVPRDEDIGALRLIPAHAGKTATASWNRSFPWAHPRSRGENTAADARINEPTGSSPLTQGKPCRNHRPPDPRRLIPAHAGKTQRTVVRHPG